jgi:hypothetical protein
LSGLARRSFTSTGGHPSSRLVMEKVRGERAPSRLIGSVIVRSRRQRYPAQI